MAATTKTPSITTFELDVLRRFDSGEDPWGTLRGGSGTRYISQALGRLKKKGLVEWRYPGEWYVTPEGKACIGQGEAKTIARVVAWHRSKADEYHAAYLREQETAPATALIWLEKSFCHSRSIDALERGDWKAGGG